MNLYLFISEPAGEDLIERHGLNFLRTKNIEIKIINLTLLTGEEYSQEEIHRYQITSAKEQSYFSTSQDVISLLKEIDTTDIVLYHIASMHTMTFDYILKHLNERKIRYGFMAINSIPELNPSSVKKCLLFLESKFSFIETTIRRLHRIIRGTHFRPTVIITAGRANYNKYKAMYGSKAKHYKTQSIDYSRAMNLDPWTIELLQHKKYILYIEQGDPFHPDFKLMNTKFEDAPEIYYAKINTFLTELERVTGLEVIVGLPPKTKLFMPELVEFFKSRQTFINKTPELAYHCQFVVMQYSTALSFAIIFRKPIFFFSLHNSGYSFNNSTCLARLLGQKVNVIDQNHWPSDAEKSLKINLELYKSYETSWLRCNEALPLFMNHSLLSYLRR